MRKSRLPRAAPRRRDDSNDITRALNAALYQVRDGNGYGARNHRTEETEMVVTTDELEILDVGAAK
jgi:hypothetical protein